MRSGEALRVGDQLGRYRLVRELGTGSMGLVFLAEDTMLRQRVCVKVLHPSLANQPEAAERFNREIVLARRISHKGVCRLHDIHAEGDVRFITMEYVDGESIRDLLHADRPLPSPERVVAIGASICEALGAAHDVGVVHRDLKPRNIMVRANDEAIILDFGIATALDGASALTLPGIALGTKNYIAPEVWAGRPATPQSDQFAVGVILYNCLTRCMPFGAARDVMLLDEMRKGPPPPPSAHRAEVSPSLDAVVLRALAFNPENRFPGVRALREALLQSLVDGKAVPRAGASAAARAGGASPEPGAATAMPLTLPSIRAPLLTPTDPSGGPPVSAWDATMVSLPPTAPEIAPLPALRGFVPSRPDELPASDASWVVAGRPVNLPATPKVLPSAPAPAMREAADVTERVAASPPTRRGRWLGPAIVTTAIAIAAAIVVVSGGSPVPAALVDAGVAANDIVEADAAPAPLTPAEPPARADAESAAAGRGGTAAAGGPDEPEAERPAEAAGPAKRRPRPAGADRERRRYTDATQALARVAGERGLLLGDDAELDRLRQRAAQQAQQRDFEAAALSADEAAARAREVAIDRGFIERKLARFNRTFDKVEDQQRRAAADARVADVVTALAQRRYQDANDALNGALALLR